jgi:hypothetical protein
MASMVLGALNTIVPTNAKCECTFKKCGDGINNSFDFMIHSLTHQCTIIKDEWSSGHETVFCWVSIP